jgi:hypothetical protein
MPSQFVGVYFRRGHVKPWRALVTVGDKVYYGGCWDTEISAAVARDRLAKRLGARTTYNFPDLAAHF